MDIVSLALAYYREPLNYPELQRTELPQGIDVLLRIAVRPTEHAEEFSRLMGTNLDELHRAAEFFIQQMLFSRGASHYRVLGLNHAATFEQIREHHRLLMRLFHPDHARVAETWVDSYARRVNEAYNVLRKPESRRAYDASRAQSGSSHPAGVVSVAPAGWSLKHVVVEENYNIGDLPRLSPLLMNNLPEAVLGGFALLAVLFVLGVYLSSYKGCSQRGATDSAVAFNATVQDETESKPSVPRPAAVRAGMDRRGMDAELSVLQSSGGSERRDEQSEQETREQASTGQESAKREPAERVQAERVERDRTDREKSIQELVVRERVNRERTGREQTEQYKIEQTKIARKQAGRADRERPTQEQVLQEVAEVDDERLRNQSTVQTAAVQKELTGQSTVLKRREQPLASVVSDDIPEITSQELEALMDHFAGAYERGDLEEFMTLFAANARGNGIRDAGVIKKDYEDLFYTTQSRQIKLHNLRWSRRGSYASGDALFQVSVRQREASDISHYTGTIRFEVKKHGGRALITGLYHEAK